MGSANSSVKEKALQIASNQLESFIAGKLNDISIDIWNKLSIIISAYIKGETDRNINTNDNISDVLKQFINSLEKLNSSSLSSPSHSEWIQDKEAVYHKIKHQCFEIESKIRSNYRNLLDQNIDNFFQYFELENISRQVHDLLTVETFFGENPIQMILVSTNYHYRKVNDFYIRYIQLVLKGMILVLTYNKLYRHKKNGAEVERLCNLFNDLNNKFKQALRICKEHINDHSAIKSETINLIIDGFDKYNQYLQRQNSNKESNVLNRYICTHIYDYFNDKYDWNKWCCYAINKRHKNGLCQPPVSYWPLEKVYCVEYSTNNNKCIVLLMRVNKSDISRKIIKKYKLSAMHHLMNILDSNKNVNRDDFSSKMMVNGICKALMDKLNGINAMYNVSVMVTLDNFSYFFQRNQLCFIRNIHREFLYNLEFKVVLFENGEKVRLQNTGNGQYLKEMLDSNGLLKITMTESGNGCDTLWRVHRRYRGGNVVHLESDKYPKKYLMIDVDGNVELKDKFNIDGSINTDCILVFTRSYRKEVDCKWYGFVPKTHAFALKVGGYLVYGALEKKEDGKKEMVSKL